MLQFSIHQQKLLKFLIGLHLFYFSIDFFTFERKHNRIERADNISNVFMHTIILLRVIVCNCLIARTNEIIQLTMQLHNHNLS